MVLAQLRARTDCEFRPATTLPTIAADLRLPSDLLAFYEQFSEAKLFDEPPFHDPRFHIVPSESLVQVSMAIMGEATESGLERSWYALVNVRDGNYLGIDLHPARLGWCYDCFHETYGEAGYTAIIAKSFTELLNHIADAGDSPFWLEDDFQDYGDAYDDQP